jgi:hypothetical protein
MRSVHHYVLVGCSRGALRQRTYSNRAAVQSEPCCLSGTLGMIVESRDSSNERRRI